VKVRVYVEGGGDAGSTKADCREGFRKLFEKIPVQGSAFAVMASGGRLKAFKNFCDALRDPRHAGEMILLLVDSERPVTTEAWAHLGAQPDGWEQPAGATDDQAHLMVQAMEAWFFADKDCVAEYYGDGFLVNSLPPRGNVEEIPKDDLVPRLQHASRRTLKRGYHKVRDGFSILALVNPTKIRKASAHAERFFGVLERETQR
jgi:hypothetical protein